VTALYGLIALGGGLLGYQRAGSTASLVAGGITGVLLLLCAVGVVRSNIPVWSLVGAIVLALLLVGRFAMSLATKGSEMTSVLYATAIVMVAGGVVVVICAALALMTQSRPPSVP
jgi:uncharacterized membrane protein (UPF0136 family)